MKKLKQIFMILCIASISFIAINGAIEIIDPSTAYADSKDAKKAFQDGAGISSKTDATADLKKDLNGVITFVLTIGGLWSIFWLIVGAMMLQGSAGNPQKRGQGIACLVCAAIGIFIMVKVYDVASWISNLGAAS